MKGRMTVVVRGLALLAITSLLAACGSSHVVREYGSRSKPPVRVSAPKYGATATVQRGQTLYRIATDNGISALDLAMWNNVPPPYTIYPGQRLRLYPGTARATPSSGATARRPVATTTRPATPAPTTSTLAGMIDPAAVVSIGKNLGSVSAAMSTAL